jgi:hypothetical protein
MDGMMVTTSKPALPMSNAPRSWRGRLPSGPSGSTRATPAVAVPLSNFGRAQRTPPQSLDAWDGH